MAQIQRKRRQQTQYTYENQDDQERNINTLFLEQ